MTSLPWKIFRIANCIQLLYSFAFFLFLVVNLARRGFPGVPFFILSPIGFLSMMCNSCLNLYTLAKYFPDKLINSMLKKVNTIIMIINILYCILLTIVIIVAIKEELMEENNHDYTGKILLLSLCFVFINWLYILIMQVRLYRFIKRQYERAMAEIVNSIGR